MINEYESRRNLFIEGFSTLSSVSCIKPYGAFYAFANFSSFNKSSEYVSNFLLDELHIATCPGLYFGDCGEGFVRFCFANSKDNIASAISRLVDFGF